jgi:hypothetical protein
MFMTWVVPSEWCNGTGAGTGCLHTFAVLDHASQLFDCPHFVVDFVILLAEFLVYS